MDIDEEGETAGRPGGRPLHPSSRRFACVGGDAQLARRLIQRAVSRRVGHRPALYKTQPASERSCLSPRERWRRVALTERGRRCTPKAFEECTIRCYALSVTFGDSSPKGGAKAYPHTRIGAFLPLPSGEVAARSADGEGIRGTSGGRPLHLSSWQECARTVPLFSPLSHLRGQLPRRGSQGVPQCLHWSILASPHGRGGSGVSR